MCLEETVHLFAKLTDEASKKSAEICKLQLW